jgi:hypothetical protein
MSVPASAPEQLIELVPEDAEDDNVKPAKKRSSNHDVKEPGTGWLSRKAGPGTFICAIVVASLLGLQALVGLVRLVSPAERWEYTIVPVNDLLFEADINKLGSQGWELVFARRAQDSRTEAMKYEMIFKRRK